MSLHETISAICTAPGPSGLAAIRVCGKEAISLVEKIFSTKLSSLQSHTAVYGKIIDTDGSIIDSVMVLVMRAPKTYTGETTVEIFSHGGDLIPEKILQRVVEAGSRVANPGEFTMRAFLNGKIDLAQAEAVEKRVCAQNTLALSASMEHLEGKLSKKIKQFQKDLLEIGAIIEAWVDFPEEDLAFSSFEELEKKIARTLDQMKILSSTFSQGKIIQDGASICLIGPPNAGKSSLMNILLGKERAIVTPIAGTTRDIIEDRMRLGNVHISITDTAGIRETQELVEKEGIQRALQAQKKADLTLCILDSSMPYSEKEKAVVENTDPTRTIYILNKSDLANALKAFPFPYISISAKKEENIEELIKQIKEKVFPNNLEKGELILTSVRHKNHLDRAISFCEKVINGLKTNISPEYISSDVRKALEELGFIIGMNVTEEILSTIFSTFCIGK